MFRLCKPTKGRAGGYELKSATVIESGSVPLIGKSALCPRSGSLK